MAAYQEYFSQQNRFVINDLSKADSLLSGSKIPYHKLIQDEDVLKQIARSTRTENLIKTRIIKEGPRYIFGVDWFHAPHMELMATMSFSVDEPNDGAPFGKDLISDALAKNLDLLMRQIPFLANISGRDNQSVTVNVGKRPELKPGDVLVAGTLEEVKVHPLLKKIMDWRIARTGRMVIEQIEEGMAFCKIIEEEPGKQILRNQKIIQIQTQILPVNPANPSSSDPKEQDSTISAFAPTLGWMGLGFGLGSYGRQFSSQDPAVSNSGGGIALMTNAEGELWLTRKWFAQLKFGYGFWGFSQEDASTGVQSPISQNSGASGSVFSYQLDVGYSFWLTESLFGPRGWLKFGYKSNSYSLPISTAENTGPLSIGSVFLGIGGDLPIRGQWGALVNFDFRLLTSASQSWMSGDASGASDVALFLGGYYRWTPKMTIRGGLDIVANSADFSNGSSISQKTVTIGPSLLYYF
jgi:hypothetical protein